MRSLLLQITAAIMETPALIDRSRDRATVVLYVRCRLWSPRSSKEANATTFSTFWLLFSLVTEYYSSTLFVIDVLDKHPVAC